MQSHCAISGTPLSLSLSQWLALSPGVSTTINADQAAHSLSLCAKVGISLGVSLLLLLLTTSIFLCLCHRRRRRYHHDEVQPVHLAHPSHLPASEGGAASLRSRQTIIAPSYLGTSPRMDMSAPGTANACHRSPNVLSAALWSPKTIDAINLDHSSADHRQLPLKRRVHELCAEESRLSSPSYVAAPAAPVEMPAIVVTSPLASPASR